MRTVIRVTLGAALLAATLAGQSQKTVAGTVTEFKALEIGMNTDAGEKAFVKFGPDTEVVTVAPGERDLAKAKPASATDIVAGDRIMATFVAGLTPARRIVLITGRDIARRNEAERLDWKTRGIAGIVSSVSGNQIVLELRSPEGSKTIVVNVDGATKIRRYAPDSVRFADALVSTVAEISKGDQLQTRGARSEDQGSVQATDVVFGTFQTKLGTITAIDLGARELRIEEAVTRKPITVHLAPASQLKAMPDMRGMMGKPPADGHTASPSGSTPPGKFDMQRMLESLPAAKIEDLKVGGGVIVTSTKGANSDALTAIMLLANADFFVTMTQQPGGMNSIGQLHGGMLAGPGGFSLPTMIQ